MLTKRRIRDKSDNPIICRLIRPVSPATAVKIDKLAIAVRYNGPKYKSTKRGLHFQIQKRCASLRVTT